ncbi:PREDICTED: transcription cofactor HES-6-like [Gavialis gangeticus]|uniref:transcription cofactor HES-6-like n=1 Tax=Gavialis gangeticus TaxID=94835 RepID=UPI00092E8861|nr:PREDICTED: transcription cofactor HES-6-like [Gavialis gangeticus]
MAPSCRRSKGRPGRGDEDGSGRRGDRKARKPLVEKQRRARINESLQELRFILADAEPAPSEETCSDAEEPEPGRTEPDSARTRPPAATTPKAMWRPW